ncbi:hypothetical protein OH77DRAFT_985774 [Trametes cingulata]|nr:hypothetical protein OH77DRAFT_985774 [Trametes cingulata]
MVTRSRCRRRQYASVLFFSTGDDVGILSIVQPRESILHSLWNGCRLEHRKYSSLEPTCIRLRRSLRPQDRQGGSACTIHDSPGAPYCQSCGRLPCRCWRERQLHTIYDCGGGERRAARTVPLCMCECGAVVAAAGNVPACSSFGHDAGNVGAVVHVRQARDESQLANAGGGGDGFASASAGPPSPSPPSRNIFAILRTADRPEDMRDQRRAEVATETEMEGLLGGPHWASSSSGCNITEGFAWAVMRSIFPPQEIVHQMKCCDSGGSNEFCGAAIDDELRVVDCSRLPCGEPAGEVETERRGVLGGPCSGFLLLRMQST